MAELMEPTGASDWTLIIRPEQPWFDLRLPELWRYRDLVALFVWRDFVAVHKQTILGPLWHVIQPVLMTVMFTLVFGRIAGLPSDGVPHFVFYLAGADPYEGDRLGRLKLTIAGLRRRDEVVLHRCAALGLPVAISMSGGYAPDIDAIVTIHANTIAVAASLAATTIDEA